MSLIPEETIAEVVQRTDLTQVVQRYMQLKRSGSSFKGLCPFHSEKTPSFSVSPSHGTFKCFGCGESGNVISFLMKIEGWSFPETIRKLAQDAGVDIPESSRESNEEADKKRKEKKLYVDVMSKALAFFEGELNSGRGEAARYYLQERGVNLEVAKAFHLGFAPDEWSSLIDFLAKSDLSPDTVEKAGLAIKQSSGKGYYDRFRHRLIFPVNTIWNQTIGFGGRRLSEDPKSPKYINSPETPFYVKGDNLYGLDVTKNGIRKVDYALLVEGNFDVISLYANGIDMAVAPMGTALTVAQANLLARYTRRVYVAFDGDSAGQAATIKTIPLLINAGIQPYVVLMDEVSDPDSFVNSRGAEAFRQLIDQAPPLLDWAIEKVLPLTEKGTPAQRIQALEDASTILKDVKKSDLLRLYQQKISQRLDIDLGTVEKYLRAPERNRESVYRSLDHKYNLLEVSSAEYGILKVALDNPFLLGSFVAERYDNLFESQVIASLMVRIANYVEHKTSGSSPVNGSVHHKFWDLDLFLLQLENTDEKEIVSKAIADPKQYYSENNQRAYYQDCLLSLKRDWAVRAIEQTRLRLADVDYQQHPEEWNRLYRELTELIRFRENLALVRAQ